MPSERFAKAKELVKIVGRMKDAERQALAAKLVTVCNPTGHALSLTNTILLSMQSGREDLTIVAGYRQWINCGRTVQKGQHALGFIRVPIGNGRKNGNGESEDEESTKPARMHFKLVPVFDVSQTDELTQPTV
jgi:hypothetical protein